jgi:hypothetical protein
MGRYAFFNTGYEYKFVFACQESDDIEMFGGVITNENAFSGKITWTQDDLPNVKKILDYLFTINKITNFNIESFQKTIQGTYSLHFALRKLIEPEGYFKTLLCAIIYHQLLYTDVLTCKYDK